MKENEFFLCGEHGIRTRNSFTCDCFLDSLLTIRLFSIIVHFNVKVNWADDETRTRDINLGKVAFYQLNYIRIID